MPATTHSSWTQTTDPRELDHREEHAGIREDRADIRAHATFGLIDSTPHSARTRDTREILEQMALAGLG